MGTQIITVIYVLGLLLSSCATIVEGTKERVDFTSYPSGVKVTINDMEMGVTPFYTKLRTNKNYKVKFSTDSTFVTLPIHRKIQMGYLIPEIILAHTFYLSPLIIVDAISGAWFRLDKNYIHIDYTKQATLKSNNYEQNSLHNYCHSWVFTGFRTNRKPALH